ncbi:MAG: hypothetical protein GXO82_10585, partial [Chlorobi bacterium]|nr:hypothetical protein [Chlorobiota bacterium]
MIDRKALPFPLVILALVFFLFPSGDAVARILEVGTNRPYATIRAAAADALPGDTILIRGGVYAGNEMIVNLQGTESQWITIMAAPGEDVLVRGGSTAWHFVDPAYLRIRGVSFQGQTGNGVNIDDGGDYSTPAHHVVIEDCHWLGMNASGNNDELKLSGLDNFVVRNCTFTNGARGGSLVDMVGCHDGVFVGNVFSNAGSNCIQAKGGSRNILIHRNRFSDGGQRSVNIGGSTGQPYYRPAGVNYEAKEIYVYANVFTGSIAPIAYVGAVQCEVVNNTIYLPEKWAIRILQETTREGFLPCGDNTFRNNIVYLGNRAAGPTVNVGSNTAPGTFTFSNNLWYNFENPSWNGPNVPVVDSNRLLGEDPLLVDPQSGDFSLRGNSPAIGKGYDVIAPRLDFLSRAFNRPRSIGAVEGNPVASTVNTVAASSSFDIVVYPNPAANRVTLGITTLERQILTVSLYDTMGRRALASGPLAYAPGFRKVNLDVRDLAPGTY